MNKLRLLGAVCACIFLLNFPAHAIALTLNTGDVAKLQFDGLTIWGAIPSVPDSGNIKVNSADYYAVNVTIQVDLYADNYSESPSQTYTITDTPLSLSWGYRNIDQSIWNDLQGAVQLTVLDGSFDFEQFEIDIAVNEIGYVQEFSVSEFNLELAPVPVPPALWLFGSGLLGLGGLARRKKAA